jgi:hypothetical protein
LATFEAIARAFGIIESPDVQSGMEELFLLMVQRTLQGQNPAKAETSADSMNTVNSVISTKGRNPFIADNYKIPL